VTTAEPAGLTADDAIDADARSWARVLRFWHLAFYLLVGFTVAGILVSDDRVLGRSGPSLVALGVLVRLAVT